MVRYVAAFGNRVEGLGGNPSKIPPSLTGTWPGGPGQGTVKGQPGPPSHTRHVVGKITGLIYDHFGDFEGFILDTDGGDSFTFYSRENHVQQLAHRAWTERLRISVYSEHRHQDRPLRIVRHPAPRPV